MQVPPKNKALLEALASNSEASHRKGGCQVISGLLQPSPVFGSKAQQKMASNLGSEQTQSFPGHKDLQNGDPRDHPIVSSKRGMGHFVRLQRCVLPHSHSPEVQKIPKVSHEQGQLPVHIPSLWFGNGPVGVYQSGKGGQAQARGIRIHQYLDDWLLRAPCQATCLQHTRTLLALCQELGWVVNMKKSELTPQQVFNFVGYRFDMLTSRVLATQDRWSTLKQKLRFIKDWNCCTVRPVHVTDRSPHSDGEASLVRSPSHEAHSVALEATLACSGGSGKGHSGSSFSSSSPRLVVEREQCTSGPAFAPSASCSANVYRRLKQRLGRSLRGFHGKRRLVRPRKSPPHKFFGVKSSVSGPHEFRASVQGPDCSDSNGQHDCGFLQQQGGRYEIRLSLCPPMETSVLVPSQGNSPEGKAHSRSLECDSGQTVQTQSGDQDRVVPVSAGVQSLLLELGSTTGRPVCNSVQS